jgi:hypothetical protein
MIDPLHSTRMPVLILPPRHSFAPQYQNGVMSLPGLGLEEPEEEQKVDVTQHDLAKDCEWRFEVAVGKYTQVKVM